MSSKLGVLIVHGMGMQGPAFADDFIAEMTIRLLRRGADPKQIRFKPLHWANVVQRKEEQLWANLSRDARLDGRMMRRFLISAFGDAVAYQRVPGKRNDVYRQIHSRVHTGLAELRDELGGDAPLAVIAHSLGCNIMSNFIWDEQTGQGYGRNPFERMETLTLFVTFGCNIPLFTLAYDHVESIQFPPPQLPENLRPAARWLNYYDRDDVLGFPLKTLSASYERAVTADIEIDAGNLLTAWSLLSHQEYWDDDDLLDPVAASLGDLLGRL